MYLQRQHLSLATVQTEGILISIFAYSAVNVDRDGYLLGGVARVVVLVLQRPRVFAHCDPDLIQAWTQGGLYAAVLIWATRFRIPAIKLDGGQVSQIEAIDADLLNTSPADSQGKDLSDVRQSSYGEAVGKLFPSVSSEVGDAQPVTTCLGESITQERIQVAGREVVVTG